jgi:hypothetical protein
MLAAALQRCNHERTSYAHPTKPLSNVEVTQATYRGVGRMWILVEPAHPCEGTEMVRDE